MTRRLIQEAERLSAALDALRAGAWIKDAARDHHVDQKRLRRARNDAGIPRKQPKNGRGGDHRGKLTVARDYQGSYDLGGTDREIGERIGATENMVYHWRTTRGLPSRHVWKEAAFPALYSRGLSDDAIAARAGCGATNVRRWRKKLGLETKGVGRGGGQGGAGPVSFIWRSDLYRRVSAAISPYLAPDVRDDAISDLIVAVLSGDIAEAEVEARARKFASRAVAQWASRFGALSLDEDRDGEGWTRYAGLPCERATSAHRIVELSILARRMGLNPSEIMA